MRYILNIIDICLCSIYVSYFYICNLQYRKLLQNNSFSKYLMILHLWMDFNVTRKSFLQRQKMSVPQQKVNNVKGLSQVIHNDKLY